ELEAQIDAAKVLIDVQHEKSGHHGTQRQRAVVVAKLHRFDVAHQARIVNPLDGLELPHRPCSFLARHNYTLSAHRSFALRERGFRAISSLVGWITCLVSTWNVPA